MDLKNLRGLTVAELIVELQNVDNQNALVVFTYDYGDRGHCQVASVFSSVDEDTSIRWSDYTKTPCLVDESDEPDESDRDDIVVLR